MNPVTQYWQGLSERKKAGFHFAGTAVVLLVTVWVAVAVTSYLYTWRQDQSELSVGSSPEIQNAAASSGLSLGHFLVTDSFGLAAYAVLAFLIAWSIKRCWSGSRIRLG